MSNAASSAPVPVAPVGAPAANPYENGTSVKDVAVTITAFALLIVMILLLVVSALVFVFIAASVIFPP